MLLFNPFVKINWKVAVLGGISLLILVLGWVIYRQEVHPGEPLIPFQEEWTYEKAFARAIETNNPELCNKINKDHTIQDFGVRPNQAREYCKIDYAVAKSDVDYCLTLSEEHFPSGVSPKDGCLRELAKKLKRPDLCDSMPSRNDPEYGSLFVQSCKQEAIEIDISTWQTYRNEEFGFEVRYPEDWKIESSFPGRLGPGQTEFRAGANPQIFAFGSEGVDLTREEGEMNMYVAPDGYFDCSNYTNLSGDDVKLFFERNSEKDELEFCRSDVYFRFSRITVSREIFNQILSTFRFVELTSQAQWNWEVLGCGSNVPCSYKVCSSPDPIICYSCVGKYDNVTRGEKTPSSTTDPRTTTDFVCAKEVQNPRI